MQLVLILDSRNSWIFHTAYNTGCIQSKGTPFWKFSFIDIQNKIQALTSFLLPPEALFVPKVFPTDSLPSHHPCPSR